MRDTVASLAAGALLGRRSDLSPGARATALDAVLDAYTAPPLLDAADVTTHPRRALSQERRVRAALGEMMALAEDGDPTSVAALVATGSGAAGDDAHDGDPVAVATSTVSAARRAWLKQVADACAENPALGAAVLRAHARLIAACGFAFRPGDQLVIHLGLPASGWETSPRLVTVAALDGQAPQMTIGVFGDTEFECVVEELGSDVRLCLTLDGGGHCVAPDPRPAPPRVDGMGLPHTIALPVRWLPVATGVPVLPTPTDPQLTLTDGTALQLELLTSDEFYALVNPPSPSRQPGFDPSSFDWDAWEARRDPLAQFRSAADDEVRMRCQSLYLVMRTPSRDVVGLLSAGLDSAGHSWCEVRAYLAPTVRGHGLARRAMPTLFAAVAQRYHVHRFYVTLERESGGTAAAAALFPLEDLDHPFLRDLTHHRTARGVRHRGLDLSDMAQYERTLAPMFASATPLDATLRAEFGLATSSGDGPA